MKRGNRKLENVEKKKAKQNVTRKENFGICFSLIFD